MTRLEHVAVFVLWACNVGLLIERAYLRREVKRVTSSTLEFLERRR